jgi:hypothetical protein
MAANIVEKYFGHFTKSTRQSLEHPHGAIRQGGESLVGGLALGAIHAEKGLDIGGKIPADVLGAAVGYFLAGKASSEVAGDLRTLANTGMTSFGFRQGYAFMAEKKQAKGGAATPFKSMASTMHGEFGDTEFQSDVGEDPIVSLARQL